MKKVKYTGSGLRTYKYKGKRIKIPRQVWIILLAAVVITFLAVLLGNYLKMKVANSQAEEEEQSLFYTITERSEEENSKLYHASLSEENKKTSPSIQGAYLNYLQYENEEEIKTAISDAAAAAYTALSVPLTDEYGKLLFIPDALSYFRINTEENLPDGDSEEFGVKEKLLKTIEIANENGLYLSGIININSDIIYGTSTAEANAVAVFDILFAREIYSMGFDEIVIYGLDDPSVERIQVKDTILAYINSIKKECPDITVTVVLSKGYYSDSASAPYVEEIYACADCLAIDINSVVNECSEDKVFDNVNAVCTSLSGSFSFYNIRAVLSGKSAQIKSDQLDALSLSNINNWQFITPDSDVDVNIDTSEKTQIN